MWSWEEQKQRTEGGRRADEVVPGRVIKSEGRENAVGRVRVEKGGGRVEELELEEEREEGGRRRMDQVPV